MTDRATGLGKPPARAAQTKRSSGLINKRTRGAILYYGLMTFLSVVFLLPFGWMISTSLKEWGQVLNYPPEWIPSPVAFGNYVDIWGIMPFVRYFLNSFIMTGAITLGQVITSSMAAYAFARLEFPGRNILFVATLALMMVPVQVTIIPLYIGLARVGLLDSYPALVVPFLVTAYGTFLLRQFFMTIPQELIDAAKIDGCNHFQIYRLICLPLSKTALVVLAVFAFRWWWNQFLWPLIVTNSDDMRVWTIGLLQFQGRYGTQYHLLMAAALIGLLPLVIAFIFLQRYFVEGISLTGIKS